MIAIYDVHIKRVLRLLLIWRAGSFDSIGTFDDLRKKWKNSHTPSKFFTYDVRLNAACTEVVPKTRVCSVVRNPWACGQTDAAQRALDALSSMSAVMLLVRWCIIPDVCKRKHKNVGGINVVYIGFLSSNRKFCYAPTREFHPSSFLCPRRILVLVISVLFYVSNDDVSVNRRTTQYPRDPRTFSSRVKDGSRSPTLVLPRSSRTGEHCTRYVRYKK